MARAKGPTDSHKKSFREFGTEIPIILKVYEL